MVRGDSGIYIIGGKPTGQMLTEMDAFQKTLRRFSKMEVWL